MQYPRTQNSCSKFGRKHNTYCTWWPLPDGTSMNICIYLIFLETRIIGLHFATWVYLRSNFSGGLCKTFLFLQEWHFVRSRSSKVIDFGTNQNGICNFLLVRHSNLGPILQSFGDIASFFVLLMPPLFHPIFGVSSVDQIADVGVSLSRYLKVFSREIIFEVFQPMWSQYLNVMDRLTDGQTERQTDRRRNVAPSCSA